MSTSLDRFTALSRRLPAGLTAAHALFAAVIAVWAALYVYGLGDLSLRVWDESRYATPARIMAEGGSWLDPMIRVPTHEADLGESLRLNKPPLGYWLQAIAMSIFGVSEFAARLPTSLATLGCAALVYHVATVTYDRRAGFAGALGFLVFPGMLLGSHGGAAAVVDTPLALFGSLFVWWTWRGRDDPRLLLPAGIAAGLAVMVKGLAAGVFVIVLLPVGVLYLRDYLNRWTVAAVASTVTVALPWHLYAYLEHGDLFVEEYFLTSVGQRVSGQATEPPAEPLLPFLNYPWFKLAAGTLLPPYQYAIPVFGTGVVLALAFAWWRLRADGLRLRPGSGGRTGALSQFLPAAPVQDTTLLLLLWWTLAVPLTFMLGGGNHAWYLLPMYLPGAVLLGHLVAGIADGSFGAAFDDAKAGTRFGRSAPTDAGDATPETAGDTGPETAGDGGRRGRLARLRDAIPSTQRARRAVTERWGEAAGAAVYPATCVLLVVLLLGTYGAPLHEPYNDEQRALGTTIAEEVPEGETVHVWLGEDGDTESIMSVSWYADRPLERADRAAIEGDPSVRYAIVPLGNASEIDRSHRVLAESPLNGIAFVAFEGESGG
ncbi:glycosyl transferase family protein [Salinarchaeum sp. Harcht-Bsk1]|uniref:ArnT family glycosyltransferase n=1 Tax=Salinarchaeum sp. Harcht-Bsk1 TaxID=1333523 RepID=UPI0003423611|nr:glycosyltransferase family 39 protein [Salinarchaeum sp. Harcht-Bsk1]AGN01350.1 glycosyl transferase family protein [Salinarchaeum sp. Harcht-Bsk1]